MFPTIGIQMTNKVHTILHADIFDIHKMYCYFEDENIIICCSFMFNSAHEQKK